MLASSGVARCEQSFCCDAADTQAAEGLRLHALAFVAQQSQGRIWQQQRFVLHNGSKNRAPWWGRQQPADRQCLWGSTAFGDNVEDEWFIVWLLLRLTELHAGTIARQAPNCLADCCKYVQSCSLIASRPDAPWHGALIRLTSP